MTAAMMSRRTWLCREGFGDPYIQVANVVDQYLFNLRASLTRLFSFQFFKLGYS